MKRVFIKILVLFLSAGTLFAESYKSISPSSKKEIDSKRGSITIECNVSSAEVYLNRSYYGRTPLTIQNLTGGTYDLEVRSADYETGFYRITVKEGYNYTYSTTLKKLSGYISLGNVPSNADIYIDGNKKYSTFEEVDIGSHTVKVRVFGFDDYFQNVYVYPRETVYLSAGFVPSNFTLTDFSVSRTKINPERGGSIGHCNFSFEVSKNGNALLEIYNSNNQKVWDYNFYGFTTWSNSVTWQGTDKSGNNVPDGIYKAVITAEEYSYFLNVEVDSSYMYPMISFTPSGSGIGTVPVAYHNETSFVMPFISFEPNFSVNNSSVPLYPSPITGGVLFQIGDCVEAGGSISGYLSSGIETIAISANAVFRGTFGYELGNKDYLNFSMLMRYGFSTVERFPPYGVDTGNGFGLGLACGYDAKNSYAGGSVEFIAGPENGNLKLDSYVLKTGVAAMYKPFSSVSVGGWAALHSAFGVYVDKNTDAGSEKIWDRAVEAGLEFKFMPNVSSAMLDVSLRALYIPEYDTYITAKFGLSYFF